jgi:uncharacterized membrane protein YkoI
VTDLTKEIAGVKTVVCWDQDLVDGEMVETEIIFLAQDNDGALWSLGEYPEEYEDEEFVAAPCWIHGIKDSVAGILVPAPENAKVGAPSFSQGWAPSVGFTDRGVVEQVGVKTSVPYGDYDDVLVIDEWNQDEPDAHALKYYARGVGHVRVASRGTGDKEVLELVAIEQLSAEELAAAREEAMKLDQSARERSKDVYAQTSPLEQSTASPGEKDSQGKGSASKPTVVRKISDDQAREIALKAVPGEVTGLKLEAKLGRQTIVVEVFTKDSEEIDVIIDPETGEVLGKEE